MSRPWVVTWIVDPEEEWLHKNAEWTLEANLPGIEQCAETLMEQRCILRIGHLCSHVLKSEQPTPELVD